VSMFSTKAAAGDEEKTPVERKKLDRKPPPSGHRSSPITIKRSTIRSDDDPERVLVK